MGIVVVGGVEGGMLEAQARTFNEPRAARGGQGGVEGGSRWRDASGPVGEGESREGSRVCGRAE
jgi:hypothetical protein